MNIPKLKAMLLLIGLMVSCQSESEKEIYRTFDIALQCKIDRDWHRMLEVIDYNTIQYYRGLKMDITNSFVESKKFKTLSYGRQELIKRGLLMMTEEEIAAMPVDTFFVKFMNIMPINKQVNKVLSTLKLIDLKVQGNTAIGTSRSKETSIERTNESFLKEEGHWKYNFSNDFKLFEKLK